MQKREYFIYRVKFIFPVQITLPLYDSISPSEVMAKSIEYLFSHEFTNETWKFGNWVKFNNSSGSFSLGRVMAKIKPSFDETKKEFTDEEGIDAPYTSVVYDTSLGLMAILRKRTLSPTTNGIANKLKHVIQEIPVVTNENIEVRFDLIYDPKDFITQIKSAYSIIKFIATVTGPNPIDADELFQKPISTYLKELNGTDGKVEIVGSDLDAENIISVAKSTAATGNTASADVHFQKGSPIKRIKMGKNALVLTYEGDEEPSKEEVYSEMMTSYRGVRDK